MREIIEKGYLYIPIPPLYKIVLKKGKTIYAYSDTERDQKIAELGENIKTITRFKG